MPLSRIVAQLREQFDLAYRWPLLLGHPRPGQAHENSMFAGNALRQNGAEP